MTKEPTELERDDDGPFRRFRAKYRSLPVEGRHYFESCRDFAEKWGEDQAPNYWIESYDKFVSRNCLENLEAVED